MTKISTSIGQQLIGIVADERVESFKITKHELLDDREAARAWEKIFNLGRHDQVHLSGVRSTGGRPRTIQVLCRHCLEIYPSQSLDSAARCHTTA